MKVKSLFVLFIILGFLATACIKEGDGASVFSSPAVKGVQDQSHLAVVVGKSANLKGQVVDNSKLSSEGPKVLLGVCQRYFDDDRLSGGSDSAWGCYQAVLEKEPRNVEALAGLDKVEMRYVDLVRGALKKRQVDSAERYLASLREVSPGSVQLPGLEVLFAGKVFYDRLLDGSKAPQMVWIAGGRFQMGDIQDDEQVASVGRFAMGRYEVTFAEYDKFVEATGRNKPDDEGWGRGNRPVINVSWYDATAYAEWLSEQTGQEYRLPTEVEWEYAARAGTTTEYWWGNDIGKNRAACNRCGAEWGWDAKRMTAPVGSFAPNAFKLYDTVGNVWEWTCSEYEGDFVLRGGSWDNDARMSRAAYRFGGASG
ncbi:MAG: SUMF1/EgtB/PvdO family nonheme iron enzyme [Pseudomonadota bacterium]